MILKLHSNRCKKFVHFYFYSTHHDQVTSFKDEISKNVNHIIAQPFCSNMLSKILKIFQINRKTYLQVYINGQKCNMNNFWHSIMYSPSHFVIEDDNEFTRYQLYVSYLNGCSYQEMILCCVACAMHLSIRGLLFHRNPFPRIKVHLWDFCAVDFDISARQLE